MNNKPIKIPGPDHPMTITPAKGRVTATVNGKRIADSREALTLKESGATKLLMPPHRQSGDTWRFTRTGSTPSRSTAKAEQLSVPEDHAELERFIPASPASFRSSHP